MKRRKMTYSGSKKHFRKNAKILSKNGPHTIYRGGIRL